MLGVVDAVLLELNRLVTLGRQQTYVLMPAKRSKPHQFLYLHLLPQEDMDSCYVVRQSKVFCLHEAYHGALVRQFWGDPGMKTLAVLHHMHGAQLPHISQVR